MTLRSARLRLDELRAQLAPALVGASGRRYLLDLRARGHYRILDEHELRSTRTSDTVFVFGAGRSLLEIDDATWRRIAEHDTVSFSQFFHQSWIAPRYHMVGEVAEGDVAAFAEAYGGNPLFADTILLVQGGWRALEGNELLGRRLLPEGTRVFRYRRTARGVYAPPSPSFSRGVVHGWNSAISATNIALLLGWRRIVLTGIDLYNKEYFWLPAGIRRPDERPGLNADSPFPTADAVVDMLGRWRRLLEPAGVRLEVYNPRSLLARELDVFSWDSASATSQGSRTSPESSSA